MLAAGAVTGVAAGLFGIGGGFIVVPALLAIFSLLGVDPELSVHMALGTSLATIILTSLRSVNAHAKRGAVDFHVLKAWAPWIVLGVLLGLVFASHTDGHTLVLIFGLGVLILSLNFLFPRAFSRIQLSESMPRGLALAGLATFLGGISALLGIGGGTIAVLTMTFCGRSIHQAVATAAGFGAIIAVPGTIGFVLIGLGAESPLPGSLGYINLIGLAAIASTSMLTAPLGAALAHRLPPMALKRAFGGYLVFTAMLMLKDAFPAQPTGIAAEEPAHAVAVPMPSAPRSDASLSLPASSRRTSP
ncbi:sulfite exporter TauE/SafE family protein [Parvularcula dongshanensis]|nr:sulfite exporter TauE/SafE family protein [Parvularcula dongshanensis]